MLLINKTLLKMAKGLWLWIFTTLGLKLFTLAGIALFARAASGFLASMAISPELTDGLGDALLWALAASLMTLTGELLVGEAEYRCGAKARLMFRDKIFTKLLQLDTGNLEKIGMSAAVAATVDGVEAMQIYYSRYLPSLLYALSAPFYLFFLLKDVSLPVAVFLLLVTLVLLPANNLFKIIIKGLKANVWDSFRELTGYYLESLRGLTTLKLFNQDHPREDIIRAKANTFNLRLMEIIKHNFVSFLLSDGLIYLSVFLSVIFISGQLSRGQVPLASALMVLMLGYGFFASIRHLMEITHLALNGIAAAQNIGDLLQIDSSRPILPPGNSPKVPSPGGIHLEKVSFAYAGRKPVLDAITLDIRKNQVTALVGTSGSGKSTMAGLLVRFMDPGSGSIYLDGVDYACYAPDTLRRQIVMVPQQVGIFSGTIAENLRIAAPAAGDEQLLDVLEQVRLLDWLLTQPEGLNTQVGDAGGKLSGGQKQKLGIARVLLCDAPYIIFDEATSSVDPESERDIWACIAELSQTRTLIIISHRLSTIRDADQIYVLSEGRVAESGQHAQLLDHKKLYYHLVQEQSALEQHGAQQQMEGNAS
ncbi:ATP-binding cassette subfamily C protein [Desulfitobacterium sp. LBE]|uniref:ABC transporter ATP-binding protein/permease n=1 Tax=Desulfitobacterium sp. LBE TaxID=884086 RepID=UPI00119B7DE7|nr:ATP-binding cassette domain-containing protein [Desulfitobacterium sp. LBE]TWH57132.1 ATP-binding cassette subfamily C protein [Desulfitobacterium sp. LBE]